MLSAPAPVRPTRGIVTSTTDAHEAHRVFVNTSRAELLGRNALVSALNRRPPGMAAVDVFESEPILQGHPLLRLENAVCTPHIGYVEQDSYEILSRRVRERHQLHRQEPDEHRQPRSAEGDPMSAASAQVRWALLAGNFVIGCGVMVVAGTLNDLARSLGVSVALAGQLIALGALVMGIGARCCWPNWVAGFDRRRPAGA